MSARAEVVVITGASAGVGRATARKFARHGARIGLLARGTDGLEAARREVEELGSEALVVPTDVANADQVESAAAQIEAELGQIDIWINNAMTSVFSPIKQMTAAEFQRVTEVTYLGYVYGTLAALKRMLSPDRGVIVQVGSALAYRGIPLQAAYCAAKHAVQGFCDSLWCELLHDNSNVKVTMVQMPALNTPQFGWSKAVCRAKRSRCRRFSSRRSLRKQFILRRTILAANSISACRQWAPSLQTKLRPVCLIVIWPAPAMTRNNTMAPKIRIAQITYGSRCRAIMARTARSTRVPAATLRNYGPEIGRAHV